MRFTRFDFIDDYEVSAVLFGKVAEWARFLDMKEIVGPLGFSDMDKMGMLIDGFDQMDMYITQYNYPYYISHMERLGLIKKVDWVEYQVHVPYPGTVSQRSHGKIRVFHQEIPKGKRPETGIPGSPSGLERGFFGIVRSRSYFGETIDGFCQITDVYL